MKIKIIQIGKTKEGFVVEGVAKYLKMLRHFAEVEMVYLKECTPSKTVTREQCQREEAGRILKNVEEGVCVVALDEVGKEMGSVDFSEMIGKEVDLGRRMVFVIGGAFGLADEVRERATVTMALSRMTFTHEMARVILLEQIYRGLAILRGKEYHV